ncbi:MAG: hypothetical protein M1820_010013 [Bogoriella megaspora]|nr:MAG: hypothetical protein M1820_010013 [Bogoriella megaspora]
MILKLAVDGKGGQQFISAVTSTSKKPMEQDAACMAIDGMRNEECRSSEASNGWYKEKQLGGGVKVVVKGPRAVLEVIGKSTRRF